MLPRLIAPARRLTTLPRSLYTRRVQLTSPPHRHVHFQTRAISFSTVPRMVARAFKVPLYGAAIGAGGFGYANYKLEGMSSATSPMCVSACPEMKMLRRPGRDTGCAADCWARDGFKDDADRV